jgi:hypothetical protein
MIVVRTLSSSINTYTVTAVIDTALCVGAGGSSASIADKPIVRNAEGNLLIPVLKSKVASATNARKLLEVWVGRFASLLVREKW